MTGVTRTVVVTIFLTCLVALFVLFFVSLFTFPAHDVMAHYYWQWVFANTIVRFADAIIPVQCAALVLAFSLFIRQMDLRVAAGGVPRFPRIIRSTIVLLLVLTVGYALALELLVPREESLRSQTVYNTALATAMISRARSSVANKQYDTALTQVDEYLALNPEDADARQLRSEIIQNIPRGDASAADESQSSPTAVAAGAASAADLLTRAADYMKSADYFSAYYYASLAFRLETDNTDARRIMAEASDRIKSVDMSKMEKKQADVFAMKQRGFLALQKGDAIQAYYVFSELKSELPNDPDVERYYPEALSAVKQVAFFRENVEQALKLPSLGSMSFINRKTDEYREILRIGRLVQAPEGTYAFDVELMRFTPEGKVLLHLSMPYAKFEGQFLIMHAIGKSDPSISVEPTLYAGKIPADPGPIFEVMVPREDLPVFTAADSGVESVGLLQLWASAGRLQEFGRPARPVFESLVERLMLPFSFVTLSLFSMSLGWRFRSRYLTRPPLGAVLLSPVVFVATFYLYRAYIYGMRVVLGFTALHTGLTVTIVVMLAVQGLLLAVGLLSLAVHGSD